MTAATGEVAGEASSRHTASTMRILFTAPPASSVGTLHPLIPLARAARAAGHHVAVAAGENLRPGVARLGFAFFPAGRELRPILRERHPELVFPPPADQQALMDCLGWAGVGVEVTLPDLLAIGDSWHPDLVVRDHLAFGACLAAEQLGIPHAAVETFASGLLAGRRENVREPLNRWRAARGLSPDPELAMLDRYLALIPFPPSLRHPDAPLPSTARRIRPLLFSESGDETLPAWMDRLPPGPVVHATLGTVADRPDLLQAIIEGLADEPLTLILVSGRGRDPASLGTLPTNVRVARYIPHSQLLPRCDAIITHAGAGTLIAAVDAGLPMVLIPLVGDQPPNAERAAAAGVARVLAPSEVTPAAVCEATRAVLHEPGYRQRLAALRAEIAVLPPVERAVGWFERIARDRAPLPLGA